VAAGNRNITRGALIHDPEHWRSRAEEARNIADQMADTHARDTMLGIAAGYDRLAERAAARMRTGPKT
jgi:hypothetical protein